MNIKFHKIIFSVAAISFFVMGISCMEVEAPQWICTKTVDLPADVSFVTLANNAKKVAFIKPGEVNTITFENDARYTRWKGEASLVSFDDDQSLLACLAVITKDNVAIILNPTCTVTLPKTIDENYAAIKCVNGKECLVGSDKGNLWCLKADKHPKLLEHWFIPGYKSKPNGNVVACDEKNHLYAMAASAIDAWGCCMIAGDTKDAQKGWSDGANVEDVRFNRDGSLVAFALGDVVLVYVTAILEKSNQVWRENNMTYNDTIKKALEGMQKAVIKYGKNINESKNIVKKVVFHDDNMQIFAGFADGKVYCSEIKDKGQSTVVVEFGEAIKSLAFNDMVLAVAGLKKVCLYSQQ